MPFDPAPTTLDAVLDPGWLSAVLAQSWPGTRVAEVEVVEVLATQATKARVALTLADGDETTPTRLCIKGILTDTGAPSSASLVETRFYRDRAADLPVRVPPCLHAGLNAAGDNGVIVMEDVIAAGATFCSALVPFSPDEAGAALDPLARLHAATWGERAGEGFPSFLGQIGLRPLMPAEALQGLLDGPRGEALPAAVRDAARLQQGVAELARRVVAAPTCLVHGDAHAGNLYRDAAGPGVVDWQIFGLGDWAQDAAYTIAAVLTPEDRRAHERGLLGHYLARLEAAGGPRLDPAAAWDGYRAAMLYGYYLWSITRKVEPAITVEFVRRLGTAVADLGAFELVGV